MEQVNQKAESQKKKKVDCSKKLKDSYLLSEGKQIRRKEHQARKLEQLENEVLKRLKDTHAK